MSFFCKYGGPVSMTRTGWFVHDDLTCEGCPRMSDTAYDLNGNEHDPQDDCSCEVCEETRMTDPKKDRSGYLALLASADDKVTAALNKVKYPLEIDVSLSNDELHVLLDATFALGQTIHGGPVFSAPWEEYA